LKCIKRQLIANDLRLCAGGALKHEIINPPLMFN
jgi:hypothetical protein